MTLKKKAKPTRHHRRLAVIIFTLAVLVGYTLPQSGLLDFIAELWRPCTLPERIQAANLDEAVGNCPAGDGADIIELREDITLWARLPRIHSEITIEGNGHTISGGGKVGMFSVLSSGKLKVMRARLTDGAGEQHAGAIEIRGGNVHLVDVTMSDIAMDKGAAITLQGGRLYVRDSRLRGRSDIRSNAIINDEGSVSIVNSSIEDFHFDYRSGAIINRGYMTVSQSAVRGNSGLSGGAIDNAGKLEVNESTFSQNSARSSGGAINSYSAELRITDSEFGANRANVGGAIFSRGTATRIEHSRFASNSADEGGAIYGMEGWLTITESVIRSNTASETGGGIHIWGGTLRIENSDIQGNHAPKGGGIYSVDAKLNVDNSLIQRNRADIGGGVYSSEGVFIMRDSVFRSNCALHHDAALYINSAEVREKDILLDGNKTGQCESD